MPPKPNPEVETYIAAHPEPLQTSLRQLRAMIRNAFPTATEAMYDSAGTPQTFPVYLLGDETVISFAGRSVGARLYIDEDIVAKYSDQLGSLVQGKVCVLYKPNKKVDAAQLRQLFLKMISEAAAKRK
jgi:uncharacterized protein YdhG (YjbR/CyaY superfamily)